MAGQLEGQDVWKTYLHTSPRTAETDYAHPSTRCRPNNCTTEVYLQLFDPRAGSRQVSPVPSSSPTHAYVSSKSTDTLITPYSQRVSKRAITLPCRQAHPRCLGQAAEDLRSRGAASASPPSAKHRTSTRSDSQPRNNINPGRPTPPNSHSAQHSISARNYQHWKLSMFRFLRCATLFSYRRCIFHTDALSAVVYLGQYTGADVS
ncbi:hypothetical protein EDC01DRAFT_477941 [Geopyxis carbonaria]|nr:hypothetical protein EDC01DRAFT_477941 [Geopyxis carbonaria]